MANQMARRAALGLEALETRELLSATVTALAGAAVHQGFDQTPAEQLPSGWTQWSNEGAFVTENHEAVTGHNGLVGSGLTGQAARAWFNAPMAANVQVSADLFVDSLVPGQVLVRGHGLDSAHPSYYAVSLTRSLDVQLVRVVNGVSTTLAKLDSSEYTSGVWIRATILANGDDLKVRIQRLDTHQYLGHGGHWHAAATWALERTDKTLGGGGLVGMARPARYAGPVTFDDFQVVSVPANGRTPALLVQQTFDSTAPGELPAGWVQWSNVGAFGAEGTSANHSAQGLGSSGDSALVARTWMTATQPADVDASADVFLNSLIPAQVFIRGRHVDTAAPSYYAVAVTRGLEVQLERVLDGKTTVLGQVRSRDYVSARWVTVTISASGSSLRAQVHRLDTNQYLNSHGDWQADPTWAIIRTDAAIHGAGKAGLARPSSQGGTVTFDNFAVRHAHPVPTPTPKPPPHVSGGPSPTPSGHQPDTRAPLVRITLPANGSIVSQDVIVHANASDNVGVTHVDFFLDGRRVASDLDPSYDWVLDPTLLKDGVHHVTAAAYDAAGNVGRSVLTVNTHHAVASVPGITIPRHYQHIRIAELMYGGTPLTATEINLLRKSVDLVISNPAYLDDLHAIAPNTPDLVYTNVSSLYLELMTDWLQWADAHGVSREAAFYHVTKPTTFSGTSSSSQAVNWFWSVLSGGSDADMVDLTTAGHSPTQGVPLGGNGQSLYLGFPDKFREINFNLIHGASAGWSAVLEYATAVDAAGHPTAWGTLKEISDTTADLAHSGRITFDPPHDWKAATINGENRLFYVRLRTVSDGRAPLARTILGRDYVNARGGSSGVVPAFDSAADKNHDGYLNDVEYAHRRRGFDARFVYETRALNGYGQMRPPTNPSSAAFRKWAVDFSVRKLKSLPGAAGLFVDNSAGRQLVDPTTVAESVAFYSSDYGALLAAIGKAIAPHKWIIGNTAGGQTDSDGVVKQNTAYYEEFAIRPLANDFVQFEDLAAQVAHRQALRPDGYAVLDSLPRGGSPTDPRTQIATLAYYYLLGDPVHTFLDFYGGYEPATSWSRHWSKAAAYDVGKPVGTWSLFATGRDPANHALTYRVYQRQYANALVLYKPLSHAQGVNHPGTIGSSTATAFRLNGKYRPLRADGTLGATVTSVNLRNGEGAILVKV